VITPPSVPVARRRPVSRHAVLACLFVVSISRASYAADPSAADLIAARALFARAEADERAGRWAEALVKIRRASTVKMTPGLRFHIALCEEKTGRLVAAADDYAAAQTAAQVANNREVLELVVEPIAQLKLRTPTITVSLPTPLAGDPPQAEVTLDGATLSRAALGAPVPVDVGSHTIQARAPGHTPYAMTLTVIERQAAVVEVQLLPLPAAAATVPAPPPLDAPAPPRDVPGPPVRSSRTLAAVATAGAVALVGGGLGAYAAAGSDAAYWQGACKNQGPGCGNAAPVRAWDAVALGAWIAGAGAGVVAVVLWSRPATGSAEAAHADLRGGPGNLWLTGAF